MAPTTVTGLGTICVVTSTLTMGGGVGNEDDESHVSLAQAQLLKLRP